MCGIASHPLVNSRYLPGITSVFSQNEKFATVLFSYLLRDEAVLYTIKGKLNFHTQAPAARLQSGNLQWRETTEFSGISGKEHNLLCPKFRKFLQHIFPFHFQNFR